MVFRNLLENAVKYSVPPISITVTFRQLAGRAEVLISDQGMGIAPSDLGRIFDRFSRVGRMCSARPGSVWVCSSSGTWCAETAAR